MKIIKLVSDFLSKYKNLRTFYIIKKAFKTFLIMSHMLSLSKHLQNKKIFSYKKNKNFPFYYVLLRNSKRKNKNKFVKDSFSFYNQFFINPQQLLVGGASELANLHY